MAEVKFGRNYTLTIQFEDGSILPLGLPFTIEFDVSRKLMAAPADAQIRIYNLGQANRGKIHYDFSNYSPSKRYITLKAGYGNNTPIIFYGSITQAWSVREGTNFITTIEAFDGGTAFINGEISPTKTFVEGMTKRSVYGTCMGEGILLPENNSYLPGTTFGYIGDDYVTNKTTGQPETKTRGESPIGNTVKYLRSQVGNAFFIDNGKSFILSDRECRKGNDLLIDASTGLLNTPLRENSLITFDMLFEPSMIIGQQIELRSTTLGGANGFYKVNTLKHRGMISPTVCGDVITTIQFVYGTSQLKVVTNK